MQEGTAKPVNMDTNGDDDSCFLAGNEASLVEDTWADSTDDIDRLNKSYPQTFPSLLAEYEVALAAQTKKISCTPPG
jgi:hypothetical protein